MSGVRYARPEYCTREWLYDKYIVNKLCPREISILIGVPKDTISHWMVRDGIQKRSRSDSKILSLRTKLPILSEGEIYNGVTVLAFVGERKLRGSLTRYYKVQCKCGTEFETAWYGLNRKNGAKCRTCSIKCPIKIGQKYFMLTITDIIGKGQLRRAVCKCDCGNVCNVRPNCLPRQTHSNCGCFIPTYRGVGELSHAKFGRIRAVAEERSLSFDVDIGFLWNLYENQNRKCALSGIDINLSKHASVKDTASLDRKNSKLGYSFDNVQWVHKDLNKMKMDIEEDRFFDLCRLVTKKAFGIE